MDYSLREAFHILFLPFLVTALTFVIIDTEVLVLALLRLTDNIVGLGQEGIEWTGWQWEGWTALEGIGTILAVVVTLALAWLAWTKDRRRDEEQRKAIRAVLAQEINQNIETLTIVEESIWTFRAEVMAFVDSTSLRGGSKELQKAHRTAEVASFQQALRVDLPQSVKERLMAQLELVTKTLDAREIHQIECFYARMNELSQYLRQLDLTGEQDLVELDVKLARFHDRSVEACSFGSKLVESLARNSGV